MAKIKSTINIVTVTSLILFAIISMIALRIVDADPDAMARPTRPKVFTSVDELKQYLDLVRDYYSLTGKARYGKRADIIQAEIDSPAYIERKHFFTETKYNDDDDDDDDDDNNIGNKNKQNKIVKQLSDHTLPEWLNILEITRSNRQGTSHGIQQ